MAGTLSSSQTEKYERDGFLVGVPVFSSTESEKIRSEIEALEETVGSQTTHDLNQYFRVNGHVVIPLLAKLARTPAVLDSVESILGPNILAWSVELFIKEANTTKIVSWHQDITYWGMGETNDEVTAWIALTDVTVEAGCMRFIPGSHVGGIVSHKDTFDEQNLLSRGQEIEGIDESKAVFGALKPGEMSLHHGRCFHASGPNESSGRRIGLAIRYVTPEVRLDAPGRDYAMLVRGHDQHRGWVNIAGAKSLFDDDDLLLYDKILADQQSVLAAGADQKVSLYGTAQTEGI